MSERKYNAPSSSSDHASVGKVVTSREASGSSLGVSRGRFISVHGIDGTGKTTTTLAAVDALNAAGIPAINYDTYKEGEKNPYAEKKNLADREGSLEERLAAYLESMMYHGERIEALLAQGFHVVKSRYLDDILAHFNHLGVSEDVMEALRKKFPMVQPDLKVILRLTEPERRQRIDVRGVLDEKDLEEKRPGSRLQSFEEYLLRATEHASSDSVLHVDTGSCDVNEVSRRIIDRILARSTL